MLRTLLLVAAGALVVAFGCNAFRERVEGSGNRVVEERDVGDVTEVVLAGVGDLTVTRGATAELLVSADDNILPLLETETDGDKLTLKVKSGYSLKPKTPITYTLTVPSLAKLTVSGAGNATVEGPVGDELEAKVSGAGDVKLRGMACKSLTLSLSGAGNMTAAGTADKLTAKVSGAGDIKAAELKASVADVHISGAGDITLWASDELKARVSGAGSVKYKGSPRVEQKVSGAGSIKPAGSGS
jgi:hypothetical protein